MPACMAERAARSCASRAPQFSLQPSLLLPPLVMCRSQHIPSRVACRGRNRLLHAIPILDGARGERPVEGWRAGVAPFHVPPPHAELGVRPHLCVQVGAALPPHGES